MSSVYIIAVLVVLQYGTRLVPYGANLSCSHKDHIYIYIKIIPYKGTGGGHRVHCGYAVLSGHVKEGGVRGSYMPLSGAVIIYMMAVFSGTLFV